MRRQRSFPAHWSLACALVVALWSCADSPEQDPGSDVCPRCRAGGETSDFGSQTECTRALLHREIDRAEAEAMGFEVGEYERVVEMPLDVAMRWVAEDSDAGGPATGYAEDTRLQLRLEVDGFEYAELDPERCDDTSCTLEDGGMIDGTGCEPFLLVRASGELETEDGAVQATLESQNVRLMRPHEETDLTVAARADLAAVRGTLRIDPAVPEPYGGVIDLSVHYELSGELRYAVVAVGVYPDWEHRNENAPEIPSELSSYRPLQGRAGSPPSDRPLVGGPGSSP